MHVQVNPEILRWARTTSGLDIEEAARRLGFHDSNRRTAAQRLRDLEEGAKEPSVSVLDRMADKYRRPSLVFYLPEPPVDEERAARFRSAPTALTRIEQGQLDAFVRELRSRQNLLRDALEDHGDAEPVEWIGSLEENAGRQAIASRAREILGLNLDEYRARGSAESGFELLRERTEAAGVFVLLQGDFGSWHSALDTRLFRGLSLADPVAPFVVIHPNDATSARPFTLLHEMVHLLLGQSAFADPASNDPLEQLCNDVAGDLLLPDPDVRELVNLGHRNTASLADKIPEFARRWRVSSSMVAYRAARSGYLPWDELRVLLRIFEARWRKSEAARKAKASRASGPSYYVVRRHRLGDSLVQRTKELWRAGELTTARAGMVLGVRATSVHALLEPRHA